MEGKNVWRKTGFGILFVAACFMATYILVAFHGKILMILLAAVLLLVSAFLFLNTIFMDKAEQWSPEEDDAEEIKNFTSGSTGIDGEFRLKISKHMKEMENSQKELIDVLKKQNALLQHQMENMEQAIITLSEKQINQTKSVIKFNKENARQLAISERETLEYVMMELKKAIEDNAGAMATAAVSVPTPVLDSDFSVAEEAAPMEQLEEVGDEELFAVSDLPGDEEYVMPEFPVTEETPVEDITVVPEETVTEEVPLFTEEPVAEEVPLFTEEPVAEEVPLFAEEPVSEEVPLFTEELPVVPEEPAAEEPVFADELDLSALFEDIAEGAMNEEVAVTPDLVEEAPVAEEKEPAPAADPLAGLSGDPNAMMTPEDIAKLLASMGQ